MVIEETEVEEVVLPSTPELEVIEADEGYCKIAVKPLDRGFGVTLGNALRRVLLSSLPGAAISWVRIDGVQHEYSTLPHVKEDVSELLLNLKSIRIKSHSDRPGPMRLEVQGPGEVHAGDIQPSADFDIVNPELFVASLDSAKARLSIEFHVDMGRGYVPAAHTEGMPIGVLPVDAIFSPITRVNYNVEKTRVGQLTDYDRLVLEVWTDQTKTGTEAIREAGQILVDSFGQFVALGQPAETSERQPRSQSVPQDQYHMPIERLDLSARTLNSLKRAKVDKVGDVLERTYDELLKIKNFGDKSLTELSDRLRALGLLSQVQGAPTVPVVGASNSEPVVESLIAATDATFDTERLAAEDEDPKRPSAAKETLRDLSSLRALLNSEGDGPDKDADETS